jgi:hypothetical protein
MNFTMMVPNPSAASTNAALSQCASRSESGQNAGEAVAHSLVAKRARLDGDLECVFDQRDAKFHPEIDRTIVLFATNAIEPPSAEGSVSTLTVSVIGLLTPSMVRLPMTRTV